MNLGMVMANSSHNLKVSEMTKAAPASVGEEKEGKSSSSDSREAETKLREDASSSSFSFPEELHVFTSASEIYSVSVLYSTLTNTDAQSCETNEDPSAFLQILLPAEKSWFPFLFSAFPSS